MKDIVSFEEAVELKKQGFNLPTNVYYYIDFEGGVKTDNGDGDCEFIEIDHNKYDDCFSAPTIDDVKFWKRQTCKHENIQSSDGFNELHRKRDRDY